MSSTHFAFICPCRGARGIVTQLRQMPGVDAVDTYDEDQLIRLARNLGWRRVPRPSTGPDARRVDEAWTVLCPDCADRAGLLTPARAPERGSLLPRPVRHLAVHPDGTITR